jgi:hypothetical protein
MSGPSHERPVADPVGAPRAQPATHRSGRIRVAVLSAILVAAVGAGVADRSLHRTPPAAAPPAPISSVAPVAAESSAWYCAGGTSKPGSTAATTVSLVNTTSHAVAGTLSAVGDTGTTKTVAIVVPARSESVEAPGLLAGGNLVATTVDLDGGGVLATESVAGPLGWSESPCSRSTASEWYFASGSTIDGNTLTLSLYNPTTTDAVVDMTFITPAGVSQPQPFEGIVVAPGALVTEPVDAYVQDDSSVSSIVQARTGAVVAAELETESSGGVRGLSVRLGVPTLFPTWSLPDSTDIVGGATSITVFNPTESTDRVDVTIRPGAAPPARFTDTVGPRTAWVFDTSAQTRIPAGVSFLATVRVRSGPGVVVDRTVHAPSSLAGPQFGAVTGLAVGPVEPPSSVAVLPGPGTSASPTVPGAAPQVLNLVNPGPTRLHATVWALAGARGLVELDRFDVPPGSAIALGRSVLGKAGRLALVVSGDHPVVVLEDLAPTAGAGVVSLAGAGATDL